MPDPNVLYKEKGPGDSGAAGTLFNLIGEDRKRAQGREDLDYKLGTESKFKLREMETKNQFDTGLEGLKEQHRIAEEERALARSVLTGQQVATQVQQHAVGQAEVGNVVPGFVDHSPEVPMATGSPIGSYTAK